MTYFALVMATGIVSIAAKLMGMSVIAFLLGFRLFFWATATWWIPMLLILGFWRHVYKRFPLSYNPLYWGAVFPLSMYTVCTYRLAKVSALDFLFVIPRVFVFVALAAWSATAIGLVLQLHRSVFARD